MIGLDFDGVLCTQDFALLDMAESEEWKAYCFSLSKPLHHPSEFGFKPGDVIHVITARVKLAQRVSEVWLQTVYPEYTWIVHVVGWSSGAASEKVAVMRECGIDTFFDDNVKWIQTIQEAGITGILVK